MKTMKILVLCIVALGSQLRAQQAKEILGIAKESKDAAYYSTQSELWKKETELHPKSGKAWLNYYKAKRAFYQRSDYNFWSYNRGSIYAKLDPIVEKVGKNLPNSFEYFFLKYFNTVEDEESIKFLLRAFNIDPERTETYEGLLTYYKVNWQEEKAAEIAKKMIENNYYANAVLLWNTNVLKTADQNSIVITNGDIDTMPRWILQLTQSIRPDLTILNQWLMMNSEPYRKGMFARLKIPPYKKTESDFTSTELYKYALLKYVITECSPTRTIHFDCGSDVNLFSTLDIKDKMYLTGISFTYSNNAIDNMALTKRNFEEIMSLEYLTSDFQVHSQNELVKKSLNLTYIPGLMKLKKHYELSGKTELAIKYSKLADHIATKSGRKQEILSWYGKEEFLK